MKKVFIIAAAMLLGGFGAAFAHEETTPFIKLTAPGIELAELTEKNVLIGSYGSLTVFIEPKGEQTSPNYEGWAMKDEKKLPIRIYYENKVLNADFNGNKFSFSKISDDKQGYIFKTPKGETQVKFIPESKNGRYLVNTVFVVPVGENRKLIRAQGEATPGYTVYYAALTYGLGLLEQK